MTLRRLLNRTVFLWVLALAVTPSVAEDGLNIQLHMDKGTYALHEPLKATIVITNDAPVVMNIPPADMLTMDEMLFIYFEVEGESGQVRRLKSVRRYVTRVSDSRFEGARLNPGESVQLFYYPTQTNRTVTEDGMKGSPIDSYWTFPVEGTYRLRAVFHSRSEFPGLLGSSDGQPLWRSNTVDVVVRAPTPAERAVLKAVWHSDPEGEAGIGLLRKDLPRLASTIEQYPGNTMVPHARYALGRMLYASSIAESPTVAAAAIDVLLPLVTDSPMFRTEEARLTLAKAYLRAGMREEAASVIQPLMGGDPLLWTNLPFVLTASKLTPDPDASFYAWLKRCNAGRDRRVPVEDMLSNWSEQ